MSDTEQTREQLLDIIAAEGMIDRAKLTAEATIEDIGIASYDMVMILMAIEEKFGVYLSVDSELTDVKTLDELLTVLTTRIEQQKNAPPPAENAAGATGDGSADAAPAAATTSSAAAAAAFVASTPASTATVPAEPDQQTSAEAEAK